MMFGCGWMEKGLNDARNVSRLRNKKIILKGKGVWIRRDGTGIGRYWLLLGE